MDAFLEDDESDREESPEPENSDIEDHEIDVDIDSEPDEDAASEAEAEPETDGNNVTYYDDEDESELDDENETETNKPFTLDDIDWSKEAKSMGDNVEMVESANKQTPPLLIKKLRPVCNTALLTQKLNELQCKSKSLSWYELLTVSSKDLDASKTNKKGSKQRNLDAKKLKNNDAKRETFFYLNTLNAMKTAIHRIKTEIPNGERLIVRPNDYYAEMIKSDEHMRKIKGRILWEQKKIGIVENRKRNRRLKKYHKELMSQKKKENAARIRSEKEAIEEWKTHSNRDNRSLQQIMKDARSDYLNKMNARKQHKVKPNMKRIMKNLKYGSGHVKGAKGKNKNRNTFSSTNNYFSDWRRSQQSEKGRGGRGGGGKMTNPAQYNKNVKRQRGVLGKKQRQPKTKRPSKNTRKKMFQRKNNA